MSKIKYSARFTNLLKLIDHRIAKILLDIENKDFEITQNYIDITDKKDTVSFTPDHKVKEIKANSPELWMTNENTRHLTHGSANNNIYKDLGYTKPEGDVWHPEDGTNGIILAEAKSRTSNKLYVIFQEYEGTRKTVINKSTLVPGSNVNKIWKSNRNVIRIGRLTRSLLSASNLAFTTKEIEDFTNQFKAIYDFNGDASNKFDIVSGDDINKWYKYENYIEGGGTLNNSCMAKVRKDFLDIYSTNNQVKLVILYDDNGTIKDNKYTSDKIKGRAILWNDIDKDSVDKINFMDRIYTAQDSDTDLFKRYAEFKGFWYKQEQNMSSDCPITNGTIIEESKLVIKLNDTNLPFYPYTDTMSFLNLDNNTLSNNSEDSYDRLLRRTDGGYEDQNGEYYPPQDYDIEEDLEQELLEDLPF